MLIQYITDPQDERISVFRDLKDKDLRRNGAFIVEGKFILETLVTRSRFRMSSVLVTEDRLEPLHATLASLPNNIPVYVAARQVMEAIAGYNVHRGILAAGHAGAAETGLPSDLYGLHRVAVLSNISNPDNIGSIFRNAAGLGVEAVFLDAQCCSPLYRKAIRVSMGATLALPWFQSGSIESILEKLSMAGFAAYALSLQSAERLDDVEFEKRSAFVFGEEAYGLTALVQAMCRAITIPMANNTDSLNVAATSAIVFDAARRQLG